MDNLEFLHKRIRSQVSGSARLERAEAVSEFPTRAPGAVNPPGRMALDLIDQAAELVRCIEDQAHDIENRARTLAEDAVKRLQSAEKQIQSLKEKQAAAEAYIHEVRIKLEQAGEALAREQARVRAIENRVPQLEMRARMAEARADEYEEALSRIETAIRGKILKDESSARKRANAA
jgi:DNA repair exonuclease SbcCD ATPase subunit